MTGEALKFLLAMKPEMRRKVILELSAGSQGRGQAGDVQKAKESGHATGVRFRLKGPGADGGVCTHPQLRRTPLRLVVTVWERAGDILAL